MREIQLLSLTPTLPEGEGGKPLRCCGKYALASAMVFSLSLRDKGTLEAEQRAGVREAFDFLLALNEYLDSSDSNERH